MSGALQLDERQASVCGVLSTIGGACASFIAPRAGLKDGREAAAVLRSLPKRWLQISGGFGLPPLFYQLTTEGREGFAAAARGGVAIREEAGHAPG